MDSTLNYSLISRKEQGRTPDHLSRDDVTSERTPKEEQPNVIVKLLLGPISISILFFDDAYEFMWIPRMVVTFSRIFLPSYLRTTVGSDF
jgi:hypothetical protein